jgi:hypothetical protein
MNPFPREMHRRAAQTGGRGPDQEPREVPERAADPEQIRTIYQYPGGMARYHVGGEFIYEIGNSAPVFYIMADDIGTTDGTVHRCSDGAMVYWISGGYLHQSGQPPTLYFGME